MATPYLYISGVDFMPMIEEGGLKFTYNDIDAPDSGRTLDGIMHRGKIGSKCKIEIKCWPLTPREASTVLRALEPQYVSVTTNVDPRSGGYAQYTMYNSTRLATAFTFDRETWQGRWTDISVSLIEV